MITSKRKRRPNGLESRSSSHTLRLTSPQPSRSAEAHHPVHFPGAPAVHQSGEAPHTRRKELRMNRTHFLRQGVSALVAIVALGASAWATSTVQVGASGKTYASSVVQCVPDPITGVLWPAVEAGLFNPKNNAKATVSLNGTLVATVTTNSPFATVWLEDGDNTVLVAINKKTADSYAFVVEPGDCSTSGNTFSEDGTLEYAASGKSYATVIPGCALNPATGQAERYVNLFDNGTYLLNVFVNGVPLTQLSATHPHTPVFLSAGWNVISAANGTLSVDYYVRDGGDGMCTLP